MKTRMALTGAILVLGAAVGAYMLASDGTADVQVATDGDRGPLNSLPSFEDVEYDPNGLPPLHDMVMGPAALQAADQMYLESSRGEKERAVRTSGRVEQSVVGAGLPDEMDGCLLSVLGWLHGDNGEWVRLPDGPIEAVADGRSVRRTFEAEFGSGHTRASVPGVEAAVIEVASAEGGWEIWLQFRLETDQVSNIVAFGPRGEVIFPGGCTTELYVDPIVAAGAMRGMSGREAMLAVMFPEDNVDFVELVHEVRAGPTPEQHWEALSEHERFLFEGRAPASALEGLEHTMFVLDIPPSWTRFSAAICGRSSAGWSACFSTDAAPAGDAIRMPIFHGGGPVEWWLVPASLDMSQAIGPLFVTPGGGDLVSAKIEGDEQTAEELALRAEHGDDGKG